MKRMVDEKEFNELKENVDNLNKSEYVSIKAYLRHDEYSDKYYFGVNNIPFMIDFSEPIKVYYHNANYSNNYYFVGDIRFYNYTSGTMDWEMIWTGTDGGDISNYMMDAESVEYIAIQDGKTNFEFQNNPDFIPNIETDNEDVIIILRVKKPNYPFKLHDIED